MLPFIICPHWIRWKKLEPHRLCVMFEYSLLPTAPGILYVRFSELICLLTVGMSIGSTLYLSQPLYIHFLLQMLGGTWSGEKGEKSNGSDREDKRVESSKSKCACWGGLFDRYGSVSRIFDRGVSKLCLGHQPSERDSESKRDRPWVDFVAQPAHTAIPLDTELRHACVYSSGCFENKTIRAELFSVARLVGALTPVTGGGGGSMPRGSLSSGSSTKPEFWTRRFGWQLS